jgi:hypothetical protein
MPRESERRAVVERIAPLDAVPEEPALVRIKGG